MYEPWVYDAKAFIDYCQTLVGNDNPKLTLDRIDNNGNYVPGNIRFTNAHVQMANRNRMKVNTSGYIGVAFDIRHKQWQSYIYFNRKKITIYRGTSKLRAVIKRDEYLIENQLTEYKLNVLKNERRENYVAKIG